jgi:FkbH-like protein
LETTKDIKCVVWDLDGTLWDGILLEKDDVKLKPGIKGVIKTLDSRGILHSIASKNTHDDAMKKLKEFRLDEYFLYPEISWNAKSLSIEQIQKNLNVGMDTIMFVDDQPFERDEVQMAHPDVTCVDASEYIKLPDHPRLIPDSVTSDARRRRFMYLKDIQRKKEENEYRGPRKNFLASLNMQFFISRAKEEDLNRAEELTMRTSQLNATGKIYTYDELKGFISSENHKLLMCELSDKYGSYGKIGLALIETNEDHWVLKLLLMSCRVMSYGVGTILLSHILKAATTARKRLFAEFRHTGKNRLMYVTLKFANFTPVSSDGNGRVILGNDLSKIQETPSYVDVVVR